ncbi:2-C-methyl-D-erythritol 2,4-cyclodiphosphate synthase [Candidatus Tachikawaea gelatinosa]|uniref:2-C-methyl-D-erythritol 2,4-cyclodiphosphate synthase n=1 Tax=Candidatus Tachikawaea gelatinosa TaxID=1410383 RepID=UPI0018E069E7|nr:2-C-methyl-D-erythritol 2,4-cyclodiphosphate synthase [Candidatus Tachikawaea gelatinosa]
MRIGHGIDVHRLSKNKKLILGGVLVPFSKGCVAHSDGDVVLHSLMDALLGAASIGDIGTIFPNTNPIYKNINSRILLKIVFEKIKKIEFFVGNIDITILLERPKLRNYISKMCMNISEDLSCDIKKINIKATTTEELGFIGREEGIFCETNVLIFDKKYFKKK